MISDEDRDAAKKLSRHLSPLEPLCECGLTKWWCDTWGVPWCYRGTEKNDEVK